MTTNPRQHVSATMRRIALVEQVMRGELSSEEAEQQAVIEGLGPLAPQPDRAEFDPHSIPAWSLPMAVAWIAVRNLEAVRNSWNAYVTSRFQWHGTISPEGKPASVLARRSPVWLHSVRSTIWDDTGGAALWEGVTLQSASRSLWGALADGRISALARDLREPVSDVQAIPRHNWLALKLGELRPTGSQPVSLPTVPPPWWPSDAGPDMLHFGDGVPVYIDVVINRSELVEAFPANLPPTEAAQNSPLPLIDQKSAVKSKNASGRTKAAKEQQRQCVDWLEGMMKLSPSPPSATQAALWLQAETKFPAMSNRQFKESWTEAVERGNGSYAAWTNERARRR